MSSSITIRNEARRFFTFCAIVIAAILMIGLLPFVLAYLFAVPQHVASSIQEGMPKATVIELMGEPFEKDGACWLYSVRGYSDAMQIRFRSGEVDQISF